MTTPSAEGRVSALLVNYDAGGFLVESVGALLADPAVALVLVVDNASRDESLSMLQDRFGHAARLEVLRNESNLGYAAGVNRGLAGVESEFALIINPDCVVGPGLIGALLAEADRTPRAAICGGLVLSSDGTLQEANRRAYPSPRRTIRRALLRPLRAGGRTRLEDFDHSGDPLPREVEDVDAVSGALMLVRMSAVHEVGAMDEGYFLHCEDLDWSVRFRQAGWRIRFVPEGFAVHVKGASTGRRSWRINWHLHRGMVRFYGKFEAQERGALFNGLIVLGIWTRFAALTTLGAVRRALASRGSPPSGLAAVRALREHMGRLTPPGTLLIGARSGVAPYLLDHPAEAPGSWLAVSRSEAPVRLGDRVVWMRSTDGRNLPAWARDRLRHVVHVAPLWTLLPYLKNLGDAPLERVVACSSTSVVSKRNALDPSDGALAQRLADAEREVRAHCDAKGIELVLLRPTLIYAPDRDRSLERIARFARRARIFPVAGRGSGLRQPVHAQDVAEAIRASLRAPEAAGRCYTVSGGEVLTYREMVERTLRASGVRPRIVSIPVGPYRLALRLMSRLSRGSGVSPGAAERMDDDLAFNHDAAERDLGFRPRRFLEIP